jgi:hypothetical protein
MYPFTGIMDFPIWHKEYYRLHRSPRGPSLKIPIYGAVDIRKGNEDKGEP